MIDPAFIITCDTMTDRVPHVHAAIRAVCATGPCEVVVRKPKSKRTVEQNARLHAMCGDVASQVRWAGKWLDTEGWKRLFVDAWARETSHGGGQIVPSLDGKSVVVLNQSTKAMTVTELSDLMEWIAAWCAEKGVEVQP